MDKNLSPAVVDTSAEARRALQKAETAMIAEADQDVASGRLVSSAGVRMWIESLGTKHELPAPTSAR